MKNWQVLIVLLGLAVKAIWGYATDSQHAQDMERRIRDQELRRNVDWDTFQNFKAELNSRLDRIEQNTKKN